MKKLTDECLNLEQLLTRCKELEPRTMIRIYFDPDIFLFYIVFDGTMDFFLPSGASFICQCRTEKARLGIEMYIACAVRNSTLPDDE